MEKLGLTSQPARSLRRGEIETVKQPSPSAYPEMYAERSSRLFQGPASDRIHRLSLTRRTECDLTSVMDDQSLRGQGSEEPDFPRDYPFAATASLVRRVRGGLPRY